MRIVFALLLTTVCTLTAEAQVLGTFRWQVQPYGSVLNLTITQIGSLYRLEGFEAQCGGNASLPVHGVAVVQPNGDLILGVTTINERGRGIHTRATITAAMGFSGFYSDNAGNTNQVFKLNPGTTCPGGPRIDPLSPDTPAPQ
jgi:hypothetical protein